ncbi:hypothetical protein, partial [Escherichia coli]|uniref:hypothetical protein n=1 Tax=Escherichia coli TaxID=562 RepID=UPI001BAEA28C
AILLRQKQKKLIMLPSETMIWQPEFTDKTLSRKPGAVQSVKVWLKIMQLPPGGQDCRYRINRSGETQLRKSPYCAYVLP